MQTPEEKRAWLDYLASFLDPPPSQNLHPAAQRAVDRITSASRPVDQPGENVVEDLTAGESEDEVDYLSDEDEDDEEEYTPTIDDVLTRIYYLERELAEFKSLHKIGGRWTVIGFVALAFFSWRGC